MHFVEPFPFVRGTVISVKVFSGLLLRRTQSSKESAPFSASVKKPFLGSEDVREIVTDFVPAGTVYV